MNRSVAVTSERVKSQRNLGKSKFNTNFPLRSTELCGFRLRTSKWCLNFFSRWIFKWRKLQFSDYFCIFVAHNAWQEPGKNYGPHVVGKNSFLIMKRRFLRKINRTTRLHYPKKHSTEMLITLKSFRFAIVQVVVDLLPSEILENIEFTSSNSHNRP